LSSQFRRISNCNQRNVRRNCFFLTFTPFREEKV